jgi:hypothetical protein
MSELTKIAAILLKNLSDALLTTASEISKLENPTMPLSQAAKKQELVSIEPPAFTKRDVYKVGDTVMVMLPAALTPVKMRISEPLNDGLYIAYFPRQSKADTRKLSPAQVLGLDPHR